MHRTKFVPRFAFGLLMVSLAMGDLGFIGTLRAQQMPNHLAVPGSVVPTPTATMPGLADPMAPRAITPVNGGLVLAQEQAPPPKPQNIPLSPSQSIVVGIGASKSLQMKGAPPIRTILNSRDDVATVSGLPTDRSTVVITGRQAGTTFITLTADTNNAPTETLEVHVELDTEYLKYLIRKAAPTADFQLIPAGSTGGITTLVIAGSVTNAEDINVIMKVAESVVGKGNAINAMRLGGVQQVQLDCVVALVSRTKLRAMSFDFLNQGNNHNLASTIGGAIVGPTATIGNGPTALIQTNTIGNPNGLAPNLFLGLFNDQQLFFAYLQLLKNEQLAKLLAEPRLVCLSGHVATFLAGGQQAVPSPGGLGAVSVQFVPFGTQLNFLPVVLGNGKIYLEVSPSVSNLDNAAGSNIAGFFVAGRTTQTIHTSVLMEDGQTFVIGGLIQNQIQGSSSKIPVLGDLPWVGAAFRSESYREQENEVVVMITPHLVDPLSCTQVPKLLPGQETRSPDDFELFLEGILEAPRGPRPICPDRRYKPAYKNSPSAAQFPCGGSACTGCSTGCGTSGLGLADASSVSYSGVAPTTTPVTGTSPLQTVGATGSLESRPTLFDKSDTGAGKPVASPPLVGTTGDPLQK